MRPLSFAPSVALSFALSLSLPAFAQTATDSGSEDQTSEAMIDYDASTVLARVNEREIT